ncbi:MAG: hypothetical protein K8W52_14410 [Deltaproteobacteria bacterium]|nr:hypothetical protein [Deltaproteobacteria bacterium]
MFDNNYDKNDGVSIWGHVMDGAATGGIAGGVLGAGVGAIPGAILGGLVGLGTGLWDDHQDSVAQDAWSHSKLDDKTLDQVEKNALDMDRERSAANPTAPHMTNAEQEKMVEQAGARTFHQQQSEKIAKEGGGSMWDYLF